MTLEPRKVVYNTFIKLLKDENKKFKKPKRVPVKQLKNIAKLIEKGIYNRTINMSNDKHILKNWDNTLFINLYKNKYLNINCLDLVKLEYVCSLNNEL